MDFEATDDGVVAKILVSAGSQDVPVGTVIFSCVTFVEARHAESLYLQPLIVLVEDSDDVDAFKDFEGICMHAFENARSKVQCQLPMLWQVLSHLPQLPQSQLPQSQSPLPPLLAQQLYLPSQRVIEYL